MENLNSDTLKVWHETLEVSRQRKEAMIADLESGMRKADIARKYGISKQRVSQIFASAKGKSYQIVSISTLPHPPDGEEVKIVSVKEDK
jgi:DNA-binding transcriptional regulator LsrR (DeoR family)